MLSSKLNYPLIKQLYNLYDLHQSEICNSGLQYIVCKFMFIAQRRMLISVQCYV